MIGENYHLRPTKRLLRLLSVHTLEMVMLLLCQPFLKRRHIRGPRGNLNDAGQIFIGVCEIDFTLKTSSGQKLSEAKEGELGRPKLPWCERGMLMWIPKYQKKLNIFFSEHPIS